MNFEKFRRTGELSDITVIVDKTEFKLHTFPLFTKSDFFKEKLAESKETTPLVVRLDNEFPGGAQIFNQLADFFYSIPITIDHKNVVPLRSAAAFIKCEELASLIDKRFDELLRVAKIRYDISVPLVFLEQSTGEYQHWAKQTGIVDKCIQTMIDALIRGTGSHLNKSDREVIVRLPLEWILQLIDSCPPESKFATLPIVKHYVSVLVFDQPTSNSSNLNGNSENDHPSAFTPVTRKDDLPVMTIDEKRAILEQIVKSLQNTISQMPLTWLQTAYDKAVEFDCECKSTLSSFVTQTLLHSTDLDDAAENIPDHVMTSLLERFSKHQEEQAKDLHLITKLSLLTDNYLQQIRKRGQLTADQFVKIATSVPKDQRISHDSLLLALNELFNKENADRFSEEQREELLDHIDFSRISEETINICKNNQFIPQNLIMKAALSLCVRLRQELDDTRSRLRLAEHDLTKYRPTYSSSTYRSRAYDSSSRSPSSRSRSGYPSTYDLPLTTSVYASSRYDNDADLDYIIRSRYLLSSALGRYGSSYYPSRY